MLGPAVEELSYWGLSEREQAGGQGAEQWWSVNPTEDSQGGDSRAGNEPDSEDA